MSDRGPIRGYIGFYIGSYKEVYIGDHLGVYIGAHLQSALRFVRAFLLLLRRRRGRRAALRTLRPHLREGRGGGIGSGERDVAPPSARPVRTLLSSAAR